MRKVLFVVFFILVLLTSCTSMKTFKGTADLHGSVYDVKNRPVAGCTILVDGNEKTITDTNGRFVLYGLRSGTYTIETKSLYCEPYTGTIQFLNETQYILITVVDNETLYESVEKQFTQSDLSKAEEEIFRLLRINPDNPNAVMYLAVLRYKEEDKAASLRVLLDAERRGISDIWMQSFIKKMEEENENNS